MSSAQTSGTKISEDRAFKLFVRALIVLAVFSFVLSIVAMLAIGVTEPAVLGLAAVAALAYSRHAMKAQKTSH